MVLNEDCKKKVADGKHEKEGKRWETRKKFFFSKIEEEEVKGKKTQKKKNKSEG